MALLEKLAFWRKPPAPAPALPLLSKWYSDLPYSIYSKLTESSQPLTFHFENLEIPSELEADNLVIYNGVRSPGGTALHIEHIVIYGNKKAFRMLGMYLIAAALRIKYDRVVQLSCKNEEVSPCKGLIIGMPKQSKLEKHLQLPPAILTECSWLPAIPPGKLEQWVREYDDPDLPKDHLPWLRLGSVAETYSEHYRPRPNQPIFVHLQGTLASLCWLGKGLLNFSLEDHPCHTWSLLNYGGHNSLAAGSAEIRFVTPEGTDVPASVRPWLDSQHEKTPSDLAASIIPLTKSEETPPAEEASPAPNETASTEAEATPPPTENAAPPEEAPADTKA